MKQQNDLDKLFRDLSEEKIFPFKDTYWEKVATQLPGQSRAAYSTFIKGLLFITAFTILITVLTYNYFIKEVAITSEVSNTQELSPSESAQSQYSTVDVENNRSQIVKKKSSDIKSGVKPIESQIIQSLNDSNSSTKHKEFINRYSKNSGVKKSNGVRANQLNSITPPKIHYVNVTDYNTISEQSEEYSVTMDKVDLFSLPSHPLIFSTDEFPVLTNDVIIHPLHFKQPPSNYLALSSGVYTYPSIVIRGNDSDVDVSPYIQVTYNKRIGHSKHWSLHSGLGLNTLKIRGADSLLTDTKYYSFGVVSYDSVQTLSNGFVTPQHSNTINQELMLQFYAPVSLVYQLNKRHALMAGVNVYYLINVRSEVGQVNKVPSNAMQNAETTEFKGKEWGYVSGIRRFQISTAIQYQYHINKHFDVTIGVNKMMMDLSDNTFYGNNRFHAPWILNSGISYRLLNKY